MSWLSSLTGIGISPKGIKINPGRALGTLGMLTGVGGIAGKALGGLGVLKNLGGGGGDPLEGLGGAVSNVHNRLASAGFGGQAEDPSRFRSITDFLSKGDNLLDIGKGVSKGYDIYQRKQLGDQVRRRMREDEAANAPIRAKAREMLMDQSVAPVLTPEEAMPPRYRKVNVGSV
jgi:hypothetical protein